MSWISNLFNWVRARVDGAKQLVLLPFFTSKSPGSIGRILLFVTFFGIFGRFWMAGQNPPDSMMQAMYAVMAYIFGGKILDVKKPGAPGVATPATPDTPKATGASKPIEEVG